MHYRPPGEPFDWELTFTAEEADAIAPWVSAGATGPLPVPEHVGAWDASYRWTAAAWRTARSDPRCIKRDPAAEALADADVAQRVDFVRLDALGPTPVDAEVVAALRARVTRSSKSRRRSDSRGVLRRRRA